MSSGIRTITLNVNGFRHRVADSADTPLLWVLRDELELTGTKYGCGRGLCGACTVHIGARATRACSVPLSAVAGQEVRTIEGLGQTHIGRALQRAWIDSSVPQCGYCQPGQLMSAAALLATHSAPTDSEVTLAMSGNLCRCGTYDRIRRAIQAAAQELRQSPKRPPAKGDA